MVRELLEVLIRTERLEQAMIYIIAILAVNTIINILTYLKK